MIYLNNAATTYPKPAQVIKAVQKSIENMPHDSSRSGSATGSRDTVFDCRRKIAQLFGAPDPTRIIFTSGATEALNMAINGLSLDLALGGAHVVTTVVEHNSVLRPLYRLKDKGVIDLDLAACDKSGCVPADSIRRLITNKTAAVVVSHCSNVTAAENNIVEIASVAHDAGAIIIVDASQSAGSIPINVQNNDLDIVVFAGHKGLYGLPGIGGLYIKEGIELEPLVVGGTGIRSDLLRQPDELPLLYEAGTQNLPGIAALSAGVDFITEIGIANIESKKKRLTQQLFDALQKYSNLDFYGVPAAGETNAILSFNIKGFNPGEIAYILEQSFGIVVRAGLHCAPLIHAYIGSGSEGSIRVSPSVFTNDDEIAALISAITALSKSGAAA
jgi:cysteine desulfurase/selenocysteine lyase